MRASSLGVNCIVIPTLFGTLSFYSRTDQNSLNWFLDLTDSAGKLVFGRLRLFGSEIHVQHQNVINHQAADALLRLETS